MNQRANDMLSVFGVMFLGAVIGYATCHTLNAPAHAECCDQFGVPLNTQLEQEMDTLYHDVYQFKDFAPSYENPCRR